MHLLGDELAADGALPDGRAADKVHQVIAVVRLHDAVVAGLPFLIEAPVVKCFHHLALLHVLVQAAIALGAGILAHGLGQSGKAFLGLGPGGPQVHNVLCLVLAGIPFFLGINGLAVFIGGAAFRGQQDVADVDILAILGDALVVQFLLVLGVVSLQLFLSGSDLTILCIVVLVALHQQLLEIGVICQAGTGTHIVLQQLLHGLQAVVLSRLLQGFLHIFQSLLFFLGQLQVVFLGLVCQCAVVAPGFQRLSQEELLPGFTIVRQGADLGIQGLRVVQHTIVHHIRAIVRGQETLHLHPVEHLQLAVGQLMLPNGCHHRIGIGLYCVIISGVGSLAGLVIGVAIGGDGCFRGDCLCDLHRCTFRDGFHRMVVSVDHPQGNDGAQHHHNGSNDQGQLAGGELLLRLLLHSFGSRGCFLSRCLAVFRRSGFLGRCLAVFRRSSFLGRCLAVFGRGSFFYRLLGSGSGLLLCRLFVRDFRGRVGLLQRFLGAFVFFHNLPHFSAFAGKLFGISLSWFFRKSKGLHKMFTFHPFLLYYSV